MSKPANSVSVPKDIVFVLAEDNTRMAMTVPGIPDAYIIPDEILKDDDRTRLYEAGNKLQAGDLSFLEDWAKLEQ